MTKELEKSLELLQKHLKEKSDALYKLNRKEKHIRYSGEMNSSIFEMLSEIGMLISFAYRKHLLEKSIKETKQIIDEKIPLVDEIEKEVERIKEAYVEKFNLQEVEEDLNRDIEEFIKIRILYDELDTFAVTNPNYRKVIDDFQSRLLDPNLDREEMLQESVVAVEKMEESPNKKVVLNLFEALIKEVFKDSTPIDEEKERASSGTNKVDRVEETDFHRVVQRQRR